MRLTKTGQPVMGSKMMLHTMDAGPTEAIVVGKLWGSGGSANLIGIIVEFQDTKQRETLRWPLEHV